ncbi:MAG: hypothetical protein WC358_10905 [Ignavibacteria bacterium]|jgi:hypothetical protein
MKFRHQHTKETKNRLLNAIQNKNVEVLGNIYSVKEQYTLKLLDLIDNANFRVYAIIENYFCDTNPHVIIFFTKDTVDDWVLVFQGYLTNIEGFKNPVEFENFIDTVKFILSP